MGKGRDAVACPNLLAFSPSTTVPAEAMESIPESLGINERNGKTPGGSLPCIGQIRSIHHMVDNARAALRRLAVMRVDLRLCRHSNP